MKILVAMSGGVDSSVAAKILCDEGNECVGCTMKLYDDPSFAEKCGRTCCTLDDTEDARSVAYRLGMPYYVFNFKDDFEEKIIDKFVRSYLEGKTPNPCIDCNRYMKFDKLYDRARDLHCEAIATGHYARIEEKNGIYYLKKAADERKDQSYVLWSLTQEQLKRTRFPLGELNKEQVRQIASGSGFCNADKPDSQDICFVPDGDYASVIEKRSGKASLPGEYVDETGAVLGRHKGLIHYTVGQHKGLGIPFPEKMFVLALAPESNRVVLGPSQALFSTETYVTGMNWISQPAPDAPFRCKVKIRYRQKEQWATVTPEGNDRARIVFDEAQRAVTPGQSAVLYDDEIVLGGGEIVRQKEYEERTQE